jgi:predicted membrane protein
VAGEVEFANDFGAEQRDDVRTFRKKKTRDDFFGNGGSAEDVTAFEAQNFLAGFGEISGVDEAVVAAADDDNVVVVRHSV